MAVQEVSYLNASEVELHKFITDASTLNIPPGRWPFAIQTKMGNGQDFIGIARQRNGDYARYRQALDILELKVFNT